MEPLPRAGHHVETCRCGRSLHPGGHGSSVGSERLTTLAEQRGWASGFIRRHPDGCSGGDVLSVLLGLGFLRSLLFLDVGTLSSWECQNYWSQEGM